MKTSVYPAFVNELFESSGASPFLAFFFFTPPLTLRTSSQSMSVQSSKTCRHGPGNTEGAVVSLMRFGELRGWTTSEKDSHSKTQLLSNGLGSETRHSQPP